MRLVCCTSLSRVKLLLLSTYMAWGQLCCIFLHVKTPNLYMGPGGGLTRSPQDVNPSISKDISDIIMTAMSKEPKDRYQTATGMISALNGVGILSVEAPHIIFQWRKYVIEDELEIGRAHDCPDSGYRQGVGFFHRKNISPPDLWYMMTNVIFQSIIPG
jgi:serine/threonine protein kinase